VTLWYSSGYSAECTSIVTRQVALIVLHELAVTWPGPANLETIRAAVIAAIKDAGYLHVPEGRRDHTAANGPAFGTLISPGLEFLPLPSADWRRALEEHDDHQCDRNRRGGQDLACQTLLSADRRFVTFVPGNLRGITVGRRKAAH
jgi:hypothetical protein